MMNIMNPPADWSTLKKLIWLRGTPINGGEELTVSGTPPLSLPNSLGKPLKAWSVDVLPKQDLNGYDAPWPAGGGENKIALPDGIDFTLNGVRYYTDGGNLYLNGSSIDETSSENAAFKQYLSFTLPAGTYYFTRMTSTVPTYFRCDSDALAINKGSFTLEQLTTVWISFYVYNMTFVNELVPLQVVVGSTAPTTYAPYSNICPIYGTDKLTITTAGKNLFGGSFDEFYPLHFDTDMTVIASASLPLTTGSTPQISFYNASHTRIDYWGMTQNFSTVSGRIASTVFTLPKESYYIKFGGAECNEYMLELGSANTEYTPFTVDPSQTVITLPSTVYTATIGSDGGESISGEYDLSNVLWSADSNRIGVFYGKIPNRKLASNVLNCDSYKVMNVGVTTAVDNYISGVPSYAGSVIFLRDTRFSTNEEAQAGITGKVYFELATPTTFAVPSVTIPTPTGSATTWATAEDGMVDSMEVTYVGKA